jgi:hypothetical protein
MPDLFYKDDFAGLVHEIDQLDDKTFVIHTKGDVQPVLDANKEDANHGDPWSPSRDLKHVARIPVEICMIWLHRYGVDVLDPDHAPAVRRLLNSNEWRGLRTGGGDL